MRWRLLRRRLSISAPRMVVRSHLPWPVRWAAVAIVLGFSGALALWAFEVGRGLAGLGGGAQSLAEQLQATQTQLEVTRQDRDRAQSIANTADSLLKTERATQAHLIEQVKALEAENQALKDDLGFFERLLPTAGTAGVAIRAVQLERLTDGQLRFQVLLMLPGGRAAPEFVGQLRLQVQGTRDGQPWSAEGEQVLTQPLKFRQYRRLEGVLNHPADVQVRQVLVRVNDQSGVTRATQNARL